MVYTCPSSPPLHFFECGQQVRQHVHLIHQAVPFASFDPFFKGRQHSFRPYRRFHPLPSRVDLSSLFSLWHCRRSFFLRFVRHVSTFLRSLRSTPVTGFLRYYGRSDSCSPGSSAYTRSRALLHELLTCSEQVSPIIRVGLTDHSVSNHPTCPRRRFCTLPLSSTGLRFRGLGFASALAGSPSRLAESSSSSYGLVVHLLLLSTSPRGDAVTGRYGPESACPKGTSTPLSNAPLGRTSAATRRRFPFRP